MKHRIKYIISFFLLIWGYFLLQKPFFILCNALQGYSIKEYLEVILHGASLDATTAGYLTIIPFILTVASIWFKHLPFRKILFPYYIIIAFFTSLIFIADLSLYAFWQYKMDASIFIYLGSPKQAFASVSTGYILLRILIILMLTALITGLLYKTTPQYFPQIDQHKRQTFNTLWALPLGGILFLIIRGGWTVATANVSQVYFSGDQFLNQSAINPDFNLLWSIGKQNDYSKEFNFFNESKRKDLMTGLYPKEDTNTEEILTTRRPNVLIILMESFGGTFIKPLGGVPYVAPHLNQLTKEGIFFSNCYANSFRTDRGSVCAFSGYPGLPTVSIMKVPALSKTMPCIARSFAKAGYKTDFLYGGDPNFTDMQSYLLMGGYQHITSENDFTEAQKNYSKWGVNDAVTFDYLYHQIAHRDPKSHWLTTFLTLSSHEPFKVPYHRLADKELNAFAFTDACIGKLIARLKALPQWKNLLIVFLPDHGIYYPEKGERNGPRYYRIPLIWTGGAVRKPMVISKIMNQADLPATILGQLGLSHQDYPFSRNVLSTSYIHPFAFYSFVNGFGYCDSTGVSVYDDVSGKEIIPQNRSGKQRIEKGKAILQSLYKDLGERQKNNHLTHKR